MGATAGALIRASHPGPTAAVTALAVLLASVWDAAPPTIVLIGVAALTGQLTVGWSNDLIDRDRDRRSARSDKPLATGALAAADVRAAIATAGVVTTATSLSLGARPGIAHLVLVAAGWAYNLGLKRTLVSWLPYAVCFGGLPAVVSLAAGRGWAPVWTVAAGALLGTGAHLVNAVPDLADDRRTGVRGLPHRLGARRSIDVATVLLLAGTVVTLVAPVGGIDTIAIIALAACAGLLVAGRVAPGRGPFRAAVGIALVDVVALLVRG
ncbi:UbiA family prenyltransferase [Aeromicrobium wangtongii]|uniref:UbiA family prenyltransferase n=1 Tax=Aeromicrobium wangtongii TaxID=2969247 RepID=UPI002017231E|nr:UbiA family prenyltransferase [Aeromicrobium wangtongii]MCL3820151.1 UbiA family prenyltransferase [Aeromicrobium wangtongii]